MPGGFGPMLRRLRLRTGLTQEELAERCGISVRSISDLERGRVARPRVASVRALADALGLPEQAREQFRAEARGTATFHGWLDGSWDIPAELPMDTIDFVGRTTELDTLTAVSGTPSAPALVVVTGPPGVGKTALAVHLAHRLAGRFPDGQLYIDLRGMDPHPVPPAAVARRFLRAVGASDGSPQSTLDEVAGQLRSALYRRRVLLVLDNAANETQVRPLLPGGAGCLVVVTSRDTLAGLPATRRLALGVLTRAAAIDLLGRVAGLNRLDSEPAAATELADLCADLPLALRISGNLLAGWPGWSVSHLNGLLRDERQRLGVLRAGDLAIRTPFGVSYERLDPPARRLFRRLALVHGPTFESAAAAALVAGPEAAGPGVPDESLAQLLSASLVEPALPTGRYRLHDLLRIFAAERLAEEETAHEREQARVRMSRWLIDTACVAVVCIAQGGSGRRSQPTRFAGPVEAFDWLDHEHADLLAAVRHGHGLGWHAELVRIAEPIAWYFDQPRYVNQRSRFEHWREVAETVLRSGQALGDPRAEAVCLHYLGSIHGALDDHDAALACHERARTLSRQAGDHRLEAQALNCLGLAIRRAGRHEQAVEYHRLALAGFQKIGWRLGEAMSLNHLGAALRELGRTSEAAICHEGALARYRAEHDQVGTAMALARLGRAFDALNRHQDAADCHRQARAAFREANDRWGEARALQSLSRSMQRLNRHADAIDCQRAALRLLDAADTFDAARVLHSLGGSLNALGRPDEASTCWRRALALYQRCDSPHSAELVALLAGGGAPGRHGPAGAA